MCETVQMWFIVSVPVWHIRYLLHHSLFIFQIFFSLNVHMLTCQFPAAFLFVCFLQLYCRIKGNKYVIHKQGDSAIKWPCEHRTVPCNIRYKYKKKKQNKWKRYIYKDISNNIFQFPSNIWQRMFFCCKFTFVNVTF